MLTRRNLALVAMGTIAAGRGGIAGAQPVPPLGQRTGSTFAGVTLGCNSYSFATLPIDEAIEGMRLAGFRAAELHPRQIEPNFSGLRLPRRDAQNPGQREMARYARDAIRQWRLTVPLQIYAAVAVKFRDAGIALQAYNQAYQDDFTDAEIDRTFEMTKALGVDLISAVASNAMFRRLDGFAQRHQVRVGMHNEVNIPDMAAFETVREGLSDYTGFTLDIGHFAATGGDPVAMMKKHRGRIFNMHIKDRVKNLGPTVVFGHGDTPVVQVLRWLRDNDFHPPANIEQEAPGWDRLALARQALEYCRTALLT
jgi:sugar phosphate isomerase/epimerase